ncbi:hypothetical protein GFB56_38020, partial [Ensifer sp. T173]|nr:hypothetical protein [Ensifer canadensis]
MFLLPVSRGEGGGSRMRGGPRRAVDFGDNQMTKMMKALVKTKPAVGLWMERVP